ncbi:MAG TPA: HNH endonuclease [Candidatus Coproplasma excrementigallinarum]|uniref:HNH endonuclease n=1 Tax=Candidatus Coproplasma excrementigallinarum TaxID=2840747 RepID=A0A9D1MKP6_9FIRM|nr:HNH endonuclease [Candidatus Coproplasma excrementigallinarum]
MNENKYKLNFEMVPDSCWYSNLRSLLTKEQWDVLRKKAYARAGGRCMICGAPSKRLEAHEQWEYDEKTCTQRLKNIIAVCPLCHAVIHIGRTSLKGDIRAAEEHFMRVNGCSYAEYRAALGEANRDHIRRNKVPEWRLDITALAKFL